MTESATSPGGGGACGLAESGLTLWLRENIPMPFMHLWVMSYIQEEHACFSLLVTEAVLAVGIQSVSVSLQPWVLMKTQSHFSSTRAPLPRACAGAGTPRERLLEELVPTQDHQGCGQRCEDCRTVHDSVQASRRGLHCPRHLSRPVWTRGPVGLGWALPAARLAEPFHAADGAVLSQPCHPLLKLMTAVGHILCVCPVI